MTFTGHEDYDSLKTYIAITDKTRKNLMTTMFCKEINAAMVKKMDRCDKIVQKMAYRYL